MAQKFRLAGRFVIINEKKEILIVKQKYNWAIPGGGIDFGENLEENIARESKEELGIEAKMDKIIFMQDFLNNNKKTPKHSFEFFCSIKNNQDFKNVLQTAKNASHFFELRDIKWAKIEDFPYDFKPKSLKKVLVEYLNEPKNFCMNYISGFKK